MAVNPVLYSAGELLLSHLSAHSLACLCGCVVCCAGFKLGGALSAEMLGHSLRENCSTISEYLQAVSVSLR